MKSYPITIHPGKGVITPRVITLPEGSNLFEGLRQQGVYLYNACGGHAKCGAATSASATSYPASMQRFATSPSPGTTRINTPW